MTAYLKEAVQKNVSDIYIDQGKVFFRQNNSLLKTDHIVTEFGALPSFCERKSKTHIRILSPDLSASALQYPTEVSSLLEKERGLILLFGAEGSGKTTLLLHLLKHAATARVSAYNTHIKSSSPYRICNQHIWCGSDEHPTIELLTVRSPAAAFHALTNATNRLIVASVEAKGMQDGLSKLMLLLHSYPKEHILDLLATYSTALASTALVTTTAGKRQPLIGIAQVNESLAAQLKQGHFHIIEEFIQKGNVGLNSLSSDIQIATWLQHRLVSMDEATSHAINPSKMRLRSAGIIHND